VLADLNDVTPQYDGFQLDELAVYIEQEKTADHQRFIKDLSRMLFRDPAKGDE
jgi:hypothetical protein